MKSDARFLINQRRFKNKQPLGPKRGVIDARKILNSRLGKKGKLQTTGISRNPALQRSFSNLQRNIPLKQMKQTFAKAPEKHIKLARDGNILITARSKNSGASSSRSMNAPATQAKVQTIPQWTPADVDSVDVEHIGISDVLDMDTLPSAAIGTNKNLQGRLSHRSLAEEIVDMSHTMVADQITSPQHSTRVYVSNLHVSVSKQDVMELFGDIGLIKRVEMPQPSIAVIDFFDPHDALRACDLYHNRLLDGQPMQCYIQPSTPQRSLISQRLGERVQTAPSVSHAPSSSRLLHAPSTSNSRIMHNPRNVRFTVKLT